MFKDFLSQDVFAHFTDRTVDFTLPPHMPGLSKYQQGYVSANLGLDPQKVFTIRQVHNNKIAVIEGEDVPQKNEPPEVDGIFTNAPGVILTIRTADCLPIFIHDPVKKVIGLVHAGWRGTTELISEFAVRAMKDAFGTDVKDLRIVFGPSIRACCYEVGTEFREIFPNEIVMREEKIYLDAALANQHQLEASGIKAEQILDVKTCTMCDPDFFSYRRDREKAGRHLSLMMLK